MSQLNLQEIFFKNCFLKTLMSFTHTSSNLQYQSKTIMTNQIPILLSEYTWIVILPSCLLLLKVRRTNSYELRTYTTDFLFHFSLLLSFAFFSKWVTFGFATSRFSVSRTWNILIFPTWNVLIFPNFKAPTSSALLKSIELQSWNRLREKLTHWTLGSSYLPLTIWSQTVNSWSGIISHLKKTLKLMV